MIGTEPHSLPTSKTRESGEIASEIGTTEQVVKNYLRKVYDKLGVSDRLELALYCIHHRLLQGSGRGQIPDESAAIAAANNVAAITE